MKQQSLFAEAEKDMPSLFRALGARAGRNGGPGRARDETHTQKQAALYKPPEGSCFSYRLCFLFSTLCSALKLRHRRLFVSGLCMCYFRPLHSLFCHSNHLKY